MGQGRALAERFTIGALAPAYREAFERLRGDRLRCRRMRGVGAYNCVNVQ